MSKVVDIIKSVEAVITDSHFVGTSGRHMPTYINKDALYPHTFETSEVCKLFADKVKDFDIDTVVGPALGGIILSTWTAHHLSKIKGKEVYGVYTEKTPEGGMAFTRGYDKFITGKKVLVVEDLTTTGGSAKKVVDAVKAAFGEVVAVCVMINRNPKEVTSEYFGAPFFPLDAFEVPTYEEAECPLCKSGIPINTKVGHGKKYLEKKGNIH
jgi:orotate phosphoribosyltransferase